MTVAFERNCFFFAERYARPQVNEQLHFSYSDMKRITFDAAYEDLQEHSKAWPRKLSAIPYALASIIRMVANLAYGLIVGIPLLLSKNPKPLQYALFLFLRNGEIAAGRIISLIDDRLGLYHVQKGQFHKSCYELSMHISWSALKKISENPLTVPVHEPIPEIPVAIEQPSEPARSVMTNTSPHQAEVAEDIFNYIQNCS